MTASTSGFMDGKAHEVPCESCGTPLQTTIGEARRASDLRCPNGHPLTFDAKALDEEIRQAEKRIQSIMDSFVF